MVTRKKFILPVKWNVNTSGIMSKVYRQQRSNICYVRDEVLYFLKKQFHKYLLNNWNCNFNAGFPRILENLENNKFIFQILEMSSNFAKLRNLLEKILPVKRIHLELKNLWINIPVEENPDCTKQKWCRYIVLISHVS